MAVLKTLNSEDKQYRPILVDQLVLDTKPTVGSTNAITSDAVANAISGSGSVPTPAAGDNGKVLTANDGSYEWADPTGGESYTAGTGITISEQHAIAVTEAISTGAAAGSTAVQPGALAAVATSGDYDDLTNKPSIPSAQVNADWDAVSGVAQILNKPSLATVATSGSYSDLSNKPTIPEAQVNSDWSASTGVAAILNKPDLSIYAQSANLATVATSGSYADLSNTPTIPTVDQTYNASSTNAMSGVAVAQAVAGAGGLPASTSADEGKVLTVDAVGDAGWDMPAVTSTHDWTPDPADYSIDGYDPANGYAKGLSGDVFDLDPYNRPAEVLNYEGYYSSKEDLYYYWDLDSDTASDMVSPDGRYLSLIAWDPFDSSRYFIYNDSQFAQVESYDRSGTTSYKVKDIVNKVITITSGWVDANGDAAMPDVEFGDLVLSFFDPTATPTLVSDFLPNGKLAVQIPTNIINFNLSLKQDTSSLEHLVDRINGKELYAKRAILDSQGNDIAYTYVHNDDYHGVPDAEFANNGYVLTVYNDGMGYYGYEWQAPQGGGSSAPAVSVGYSYPPVNYPSYTSAETNPLNLSANTIRCKFTAGTDPTQLSNYFTWTLVDATDNIWDGSNYNSAWVYMDPITLQEEPLFNEAASYLEEVLGANTAGITSIKKLFDSCSNLTSVALFDTSSCTSLANMFYGCSSLTSIPAFDTSSCTDFEGFCDGCQNLTTLPLIDTSKATTLAYAFRGCSSLEAIPMLDTANCTDFMTAFQNCTSLEEVPLLDTSKGAGFSAMFAGCTSLKYVPMFATSSASDVGNMFDGCTHVEYGALQLYQQMTSQANVPTRHDDTFRDCGSLTTNGAAELAQIDPSWGGTAV